MSAFGQKHRQPAPIRYSGINVGTSQLDLPIPIFWGQRRLSTNAMGFGSFASHNVNGKGKGGGAKSNQPKDYTAAVALGLCEGVIDSIARAWASGSTTTTTSLSALNMTLKTGTAIQTPIGGSDPFAQLAYALTAYLYCPKLDLGESATIPDNAFECVRANGFSYTRTTTKGWIDPSSHTQYSAIDCLMSDIVFDLLTNVQYGLGFVSGDIADLTQYATYQRAQGLFFSPLLNQAEKATAILDRWATLSNAWIFWDGTALRAVPLADAAITGNGVTFTPQNDVAYDLGLADFLAETGADSGPVKVSRIDPADAYNRTVVNITDRTLGYISNPVEFKDQGLVDAYGLRDNSNVQADEICDPDVGRIVAQFIGKRAAYIRNTYSFRTGYRFILCLPGTVLTLTEPNIGLNKVRVRVTKISEDANGELSFECEEFPGTTGTYVAPVTTASVVTATTPDQLAAPGNVNTPAIVETSSAFTGAQPRLFVAASGGAQWGGCTVNISFDGTNYSQIGVITAAARQGTLTASLASYGGANPDNAHTLSVDCTESLGTPNTAVTHADASALRSLALVAAQPSGSSPAVVPTNGELLAFGAVSATGTYTADLTYLYRGAYGTTGSSHSSGDQFTVLDVSGADGSTIGYDLPAQYVGQTIFLKLASFNLFGLAQQDLTTCTEYQYTPTGAGFEVVATADADLPAGAFVYVHDVGGAKHAALADNTTAGYANGFVLNKVASGAVGVIETSGFNAAVAVAANQAQVWLGTAGGYLTSPPTTPGALVQVIGNAVVGKGVYFLPAAAPANPRLVASEAGAILTAEAGAELATET